MLKKFLALLVIGAHIFVLVAWSTDRSTFMLTAFDVGQGDAILVRCGSHDTLIDGGPDDAVLAKIGRARPPFDRVIERIVLTHPHRDHFMGLTAVIERYRVGEIVLAQDDRESDPEYARFLHAARGRRVPLRRVTDGDGFDAGTCARFEVLSPERGSESEDPNEASVILRLSRSREDRALALLVGDATAANERKLLDAGIDIRATVLKVGHHGSKYSSSPEFLAAVAPDIAVISAGAKNRYGHPAPIILARLRRAGTETHRTDREGDVRIDFPETGPPRIRSGAKKNTDP